MKKWFLILIISKLLNEVDNFKPIIKYIDKSLNEEVGKKGGVIFHITNMTDVEGITYTKREVLFNKTILGENNAIYKVGCSPWLYENFYIICEFDEAIPEGKYSFNFNSSEDIFNYSGYEIHLQSNRKNSFQIQKLDIDKPDIYSGPQIINVTDDIDNYILKYNIKSYNDEQLYIWIMEQDDAIIPISIISLECKRNNDNLICPIKKTTLECYGTLINSGRIYYMIKDVVPERFYLIPKFQINFSVQKINVYINITKLLTKYLDMGYLIAYEANITPLIPEVNVLFNINLFENIESNMCFFRKAGNSPLLLLCSVLKEGIYSLKEIKNEIIISDINYKYNFIILPVINNEKATVNNYISSIPFILNNNPKILDFNKIDLIQIDIIFLMERNPYASDAFSFKEDAENLNCEINLKYEDLYKIRCNVSKKNFKGENNKYYYLIYENPASKKKSILYYSSPVTVILPTNNNNMIVYIFIIAMILIVINISVFIIIFIYKKKNHDIKEEVLDPYSKVKD